MNRQARISRVVTVIILIALIRTILEPLRLQYYSSTDIPISQIWPFLLAGGICGIGLLIMTILSFYHKYKSVTLLSILIILSMLIIKYRYL